MLKIPITAIILAGGQGVRMGKNDKGLQLLKNKPLYCHVIDRIKSQVDTVVINSNRNFSEYKQSTYPVFPDELSGFLGPLAGIHAGLIHSATDWNLIVSCDTPFLPDDLVERMQNYLGQHRAAYVFDGEKTHPTLLLIHRSVAQDIKQYLEKGDRKLLYFLNKIDAVEVDFSDKEQSFININTLEELAFWNNVVS